MSYFDAIRAAAIKENEDGQSVYFPWGRFGSGYVVPINEQKQIIQQKHARYAKLYFVASLILFFAIGQYLDFPYAVGLAVIIPWVPFWFGIRNFIRGWEKSNERLSYKDSTRAMAANYSFKTLWVFLIGSVAMSLLFIGIFFTDNPNKLALSVVTIGMILCAVSFAHLIRVKRSLPLDNNLTD